MTNFNFNSKETYLAARAEWKANYARLTQEARDARAEFREAARAFSKTGSYDWNAGYKSETNAAYLKAEREMWAVHSKRAGIRAEANRALHELSQMKAQAAAQWEAARALA